MKKKKHETKQAVLDLTIHRFRPLGGVVPISASLKLVSGDRKVFRTDGKSITIYLWKGDAGDTIELNFRFRQRRYIPLGIAFSSVSGEYYGQLEFNRIEIETVTHPRLPRLGFRQLRVRDLHDPRRNRVQYDYVILVQDTQTGEVGLIDPDISNDPVKDPPEE